MQPRKNGKFAALDLVLRFWAKVDKNGPIPTNRPELGPCWVWMGGVMGKGYGHIWSGNRLRPSHCIAWEWAHGPMSEGLQIDHLCRNPRCVNVGHLDAVTGKVNVLRGEGPTAKHARQTHCKNGHPLSGDNLSFHKSGTRRYRNCKTCVRLKWDKIKDVKNAARRKSGAEAGKEQK